MIIFHKKKANRRELREWPDLWTSVVNWLPVLLLLEVLLLLLVGSAPGRRVSVTRGNGRVAGRGVGHRGTHHRLRRRLLLKEILYINSRQLYCQVLDYELISVK